MSSAPLSATELAGMIDHTLLTPEATHNDVAKLVADAKKYGTWSVCVSPSMLPLNLDMGDVHLAVVCGFPSGKHTSAVKAAEAREAIAAGAEEVDMVINLGLVKEGRWEDVTADIAAVKQAVPDPKILKVIIESAVLTRRDRAGMPGCREGRRRLRQDVDGIPPTWRRKRRGRQGHG